MPKVTGAGAALAAALSVVGVVLPFSVSPVTAEERDYAKVGDWTIKSVYDGGRFHRCLAHLSQGDGALRVHHFTNGEWHISIPCYGRSTQKGVPMYMIGRTNEATVVKLTTDMRACRSSTGRLDASGGWVEGLRTSRELSIDLGFKTPKWRIAGIRQAMASVGRCVNEASRAARGVAATPPALPAPRAGAGVGCPTPGAVRSIESKLSVHVDFVNNSGRGITLHWLDFQGNRKAYRTLRHGEQHRQQTFVSHPWLAVDGKGACWPIYWPALGKSRHVFNP